MSLLNAKNANPNGSLLKEWVTSYQDPFQRRIAAIVDPLGDKRKSKALTYEDVIKAQARLEEEISGFQKDAEAFKGIGAANAETIRRSFETLDPIIKSWRDTFSQDLAGLPKPVQDTTQVNLPDVSTILAKAAGQKRKAAPQSTILGGALQKTSRRPAKTLLGY